MSAQHLSAHDRLGADSGACAPRVRRPTVMGQTRFSVHTIYDMLPATRLFTPGAPATIGIGLYTRFVVTSQKRTLAG